MLYGYYNNKTKSAKPFFLHRLQAKKAVTNTAFFTTCNNLRIF